MILVTGAAGKTGKAVIEAVAARGGQVGCTEVRPLVHRAKQAAEVAALGAHDVTVGRFDDAEALARAVSGVTAIYHICPNVSPHEMAYAKAVVAAAKAAGVRRLVYHSVLHPQIEAMPHHWAKLRVEEMLLASGLDVTTLQPPPTCRTSWRDGVRSSKTASTGCPTPSKPGSASSIWAMSRRPQRWCSRTGHGGATYELVGTAPLTQTRWPRL